MLKRIQICLENLLKVYLSFTLVFLEWSFNPTFNLKELITFEIQRFQEILIQIYCNTK